VRVRPPDATVGTIAVSPLAPLPTLTVNDSWLLLQVMPENDEAFRPSSQFSIWREETMGTPCAFAEASNWSLANVSGLSVCMFATNAP
jgi:hypothetical protein